MILEDTPQVWDNFWQLKVLQIWWKIFLFHLKSSFHFKVIKVFGLTFRLKNDLIRKIRLISKFMTSEPGKQINAIQILPNISRSKGNQTMKFGQWIDYNMRNIFFEKLCTKCDGETISRLLYKKPKLSISLINSLKFLYDFIYCLLSWGLSKYIETKLQSIFFYLI